MDIETTLGKSLYWKLLHFIIAFIINVILVRVFKPELASTFYTLVYIASLAVGFFTLGLDVSLNFFLTKKTITIANVHALSILVLLGSLIFSLPCFYFYYLLVPEPFLSLNQKLILSILYLSGGLLTVLSETIFTTKHEKHKAVKINLALTVFLLLTCFLLKKIISIEVSRIAFIYAYFGVYFLTGCLLFIYSIKKYNLEIKFDFKLKSAISYLYRFSLFIFITNFLFVFYSRIPLFVLPHFLDSNSLGNYIQAFKVVEYIITFMAFIYYPIITIVAQEDKKSVSKELILFLIRLSNTFILVVISVVLILGPSVFTSIFGVEYYEMYSTFLYFTPGLFALCASTFLTAYFYGSNKTHYNFISACISILSLLTLLLLVKRGKTTEAALAFSLASILSYSYDLICFRKEIRFKYGEILFLNISDKPKLKRLLKAV